MTQRFIAVTMLTLATTASLVHAGEVSPWVKTTTLRNYVRQRLNRIQGGGKWSVQMREGSLFRAYSTKGYIAIGGAEQWRNYSVGRKGGIEKIRGTRRVSIDQVSDRWGHPVYIRHTRQVSSREEPGPLDSDDLLLSQ